MASNVLRPVKTPIIDADAFDRMLQRLEVSGLIILRKIEVPK
jgi:hypothetical protein